MSLALAVDLGGTKLEMALVDPLGQIVPGSRARIPTGPQTDHRSLRDSTSRLLRSSQRHPRWDEVTGIGVGSAGPIDLATGTISPLNLPGAREFPLVDVLSEAATCEDVTLRLDGTCIALAEWRLGAARGVKNALVMVVSTGVGGGIVSDGNLVSGASGNAGHIGQLLVHEVADDVKAGTVEGLASGPQTVRWAQQQGWRGETGEELAAAARDSQPLALRAISRSATAVGIGLANAANLLDLELAVIGGGFAAVSDDYTDQVQRAVQAHAVNAFAARLRVAPAALGGDAPLVGAASLVTSTYT